MLSKTDPLFAFSALGRLWPSAARAASAFFAASAFALAMAFLFSSLWALREAAASASDIRGTALPDASGTLSAFGEREPSAVPTFSRRFLAACFFCSRRALSAARSFLASRAWDAKEICLFSPPDSVALSPLETGKTDLSAAPAECVSLKMGDCANTQEADNANSAGKKCA